MDVKSGLIPDDMDWQTAFEIRPEFEVYGVNPAEARRLFEGRLAAARKRHDKKADRAEQEEQLLDADLVTHPTQPTNSNGRPRWDNSTAQALLKKDVDNGKHLGVKPMDFYKSRPEYYNNFTHAEIVGHLKQEVRTRKFLHQYRGKKGYDTY